MNNPKSILYVLALIFLMVCFIAILDFYWSGTVIQVPPSCPETEKVLQSEMLPNIVEETVFENIYETDEKQEEIFIQEEAQPPLSASPENTFVIIEKKIPLLFVNICLDWEIRWQEAPAATEMWLIMKSFGWTDAACAGILGNIAYEVGGGNFKNINPFLYNKYETHWGICQWSKEYFPEIQPTEHWTPNIREQLEFLRKTITTPKKGLSDCGFDEEYLMSVTSPSRMARKFSLGYERPGGGVAAAESRASAAKVIYNYYTSELSEGH